MTFLAGPYDVPSGEDDFTASILAILQRWADGLAGGQAHHWYPDPRYVWRNPDKTVEQKVDDVFKAIKDRWALELPRVVKRDGLGLAEAGPDFESLKLPQREAMCQEIDQVLRVLESQDASASLPEPEMTVEDVAW